jgi:hypothetical protein
MNYSKILFLFPIVLGIFFILAPYNNNIIEASTIDLLFVCVIFLTIIAIFSLIIRLIIKDNTKSIWISSIGIILFFIYIPIHRILFENQINENELSNHIILFSVLMSIFLGAIFFLVKSKNNFENILKIVFIISLSLVVINVSEIQYFYLSGDNLFVDNSEETFPVDNNNLRDVYHIILDAHASTPALKQYFNYDNSNFENFLKDKGFFIPEFTMGNYFYTETAIPSLLNMDYVGSNWKSEKELSMIVREMVDESSVVKNFQRNGYQVISFHNEYNLDPTNDVVKLCVNDVRSMRLLIFYVDNTPLGMIKELAFSTLDQISNEKGNASYKPLIENRICSFNELSNVGEKFSQPVFVNAHLIMPHGPFIFDSNGNIIDGRAISNEEIPDAYLAQLQYTDTKIQGIVKKLLEKDPKPIIIIHSDHGFRFKINQDDDILKHGFLNFGAYYFPEKELDKEEYSIISPVNTFRILFNEYFGTDYEILENKSFIIKDSKFVDVTDFVISNSVFKEN